MSLDYKVDKTQNRSLHNMKSFWDTNDQDNKGCAIFIRKDLMFSQIFSISQISKSIDSVWGMLSINGKRFILGCIYVKLDHCKGISDMLHMLDMAKTLSVKHKCVGVLLLGDMNARHFLWNDTMINDYGKIIETKLDWTEFGIHNPCSPTFIASNGKSMIDLIISSNKVNSFINNIRVDNEVQLFSGAPTRGHVPLLFDVMGTQKPKLEKREEKIDLTSMDWASFR